MKCKQCGSYAINPQHHGREPGTDLDLCDVCYWRKRADRIMPPDWVAVARERLESWQEGLHISGGDDAVLSEIDGILAAAPMPKEG